MSWSLAIGCFFIIGGFIYALTKIRCVRSLYRRRSRHSINTSSVVWRDISRSSYTPIPDQSSISWQDFPQNLLPFNAEQSPFEYNETWDLDDSLTDSSNSSSSNSDFLDIDYDSNIQELLTLVIGTRDFLTQEEFIPGQRVYFCRNCTLAHHEDSWQESGNRCSHCNSGQYIQAYILPNGN